MAKMYPGDLAALGKTTEGERKTFRFLREAARPDRDFICWHEPPIGGKGKEPDFVLFNNRLGLLVLEVKDWSIHQIVSYTPTEFQIRISRKIHKKKNPDKQAKGYVNALLERLREIPELVTNMGPYEGQLKIPIGRMVVFPHIVYEQYKARGLQWMIPMERALLEDDMEPTGEIQCDPTGTKFSDRIAGSFPFRFQGLTPQEIDKLRFVIWNESQIRLPLRGGSGKARFLEEVQALDEAQGRVALHLKPGHMIIKGPPGSGKTLVLVHRCCHLYKLNPQVKRVLLVCFNIALVSYLKRLIQEKGLGIGDGGICVYHFYELCSQILQEPIHFENEESDYYDVVMQEALVAATGGDPGIGSFDAVFIDEGQDFSDDMLRTVLGLLKPEGDLVIALDSYQDLYSRRISWKRLGVKAAGRTRHLKKVYRNTREIFDFTQRFIGEIEKLEKQPALLPDVSILHGGLPEVLLFPDQQAVEGFLVQDLGECLDSGDYRKSEIAIIYDDKVYGLGRFAYDNRALPMRVLMKLEGAGIPATWVSQDVRSKQMYDVTTERVSLISIHSSKGLDFGLVYLLGVDRFRPTDATRAKLTNLIYVAMTRAKYRLVIPYVEETEIMRKMLASLPR
jgi:hypothetical protein